MRGVKFRRALACAVVAAGAGCNLVVDLDGLSGGPADTSVSDSGPLGDTGAADTSRDDSGDAALVDAGSYCAQHPGHTLCEDFDESTDLTKIFDKLDDSMSLGLDSIAASAPRSFRAVYPRSGDYVNEIATKNLPSGNKIAIGFDFRADHDFTSGKVVPVVMWLPRNADTKEHFFYFESYGGPLRFLEDFTPYEGGASYSGGDIEPTATLGKFIHVDVTIDRALAHVRVALDGKTVVDRDMITGFEQGTTELRIGRSSDPLSGGTATFYVDNITVDVSK